MAFPAFIEHGSYMRNYQFRRSLLLFLQYLSYVNGIMNSPFPLATGSTRNGYGVQFAEIRKNFYNSKSLTSEQTIPVVVRTTYLGNTNKKFPQQQPFYFQSHQRQDIGLDPQSQSSLKFPSSSLQEVYDNGVESASQFSTIPNYANNVDNYFFDSAHQSQYSAYYSPLHSQKKYFPTQQSPQYLRPPFSSSQPKDYEYQLGEIPASDNGVNYPNHGVQRPHLPLPSGASTYGLDTLASLFTSMTQFTNLLVNVFTNSAFTSNSASADHHTTQQAQAQHPLNIQLVKALENIARNDDLQCVPKVLCQMIAGQTQRGQVSNFIAPPAITSLLAGLPGSSPALIYGRAALLGVSGGAKSCVNTYTECPNDEYDILHYLNNHRGGFFKFFNEPEILPASPMESVNADDNKVAGSTSSFWNILFALTGNTSVLSEATVLTTTKRPNTAFNIASGVGNLFTKVIGDYLGSVEHQRRRRSTEQSRRSEIHTDNKEELIDNRNIMENDNFRDEEDNEDTDGNRKIIANSNEQYFDVQSRIMHTSEIKPIITFPGNDQKLIYENLKLKEKKLRIIFPEENIGYAGNKLLSECTRCFSETSYNYNQHSSVETDRRRKELQLFPPKSIQLHGKMLQENQMFFLPYHSEKHVRNGRILNRPSNTLLSTEYLQSTQNSNNQFTFSSPSHVTQSEDYKDQNLLNGINLSKYYSHTKTHFTTASSTVSNIDYHKVNQFHNTMEYGPPSSNSNKYTDTSINTGNRIVFQGLQNNNDYSDNYYDSSNSYNKNYKHSQLTTKKKNHHEDDKNIYVTNGQGTTEYYITPSGRKVFL